jgi:hypothetical protein
MSDERRKIYELAARYENEPTLRDVYVEGQFDAAVVSWFLREHGCEEAVVYEIDTVEVPKPVLDKYGLDEGHKGRVIALCLELAELVKVPGQVAGIADRDYDSLRGIRYESPLLRFTDYSCMEMYCFNEEVLARFFHFFVRKPGYTPEAFIPAVRGVLQEAFLMRAANLELRYGLEWLELVGQCKVTQGAVEFDSVEFAKKYLNRGAKLRLLDEFNAQLAAFRAAVLGSDPRHCINGHDFVGLLARYIRAAVRNKNLADEDAVERQLTADLDYRSLAAEPLFRELLTRVRPSPSPPAGSRPNP